MVIGGRVVLNYENAAGPVGNVPQSWPGQASIHRDAKRPTLVMLAHPRCPCTRATMGELARIMAETQGKMDAYVLFFRPHEAPADWDDTDLRRSAAAIPGVQVVTDIDGRDAERFGGETSGHTVVYSRDGQLLFSGGITDARGHAGGNNGESAVLAVAENQIPGRRRTLVFGCRISDQKGAATNAVVACAK